MNEEVKRLSIELKTYKSANKLLKLTLDDYRKRLEECENRG